MMYAQTYSIEHWKTPINAAERMEVFPMSQVSEVPSGERRIMRLAAVEARVGFKRAHIYALMEKDEFPKARRIGVRAVGWDSLEIDEWLDKRLQSQA